MNVFVFTFTIILYSIVFTQSFKLSNVFYNRSQSGKREVAAVDNNTDLSISGDDFSGDHVDCSDFNSTWIGRTVKWVLKSTSNHDVPSVRFFVSSRIQPARVELLLGENFRLEPTDLKVDRETVIIVHGFKSSGMKSWVKRMEEAFLLWGDVNVVVVDWSGGSKSYNYYTAAVNTNFIGNQIARFLGQIVNITTAEKSSGKPNWGKLYLVGHSLGSHISGVAARTFKEMKTDWRVNRITGLDPAQLCFRGVDADFRLDSTDADFVDVIHSSASGEKVMGFGNFDPIGHIDFYPNGGKIQPGCARRKKSLLRYLKVPKTSIGIAKCSHQRSYHYFTESLVAAASKNCTFWARPWDTDDVNVTHISWEPCTEKNCARMGIDVDQSRRGTFYVSTSAREPYCIPQ